jgi:hypothetical protein
MPPAELDLAKRLALLAAFVFVFTAGFCHLERTYSQKFQDITGEAKWIWANHDMGANQPVAFFAVRDVDLPASRYYTHLKILGDPEYTLWINGKQVSSRFVTSQKTLDLYDLSSLVETGRNRIAIGVRAPLGNGGLIAALDLGPEVANWLTTDGEWKIYRRWDPSILLHDVTDDWEKPAVIGEPPIGRWDFLGATRRLPDPPEGPVIQPVRTFRTTGLLPEIRMSSGVAVAVANSATATAFDFGFTRGQLRLTLERPRRASTALRVRFANDEKELSYVEWNLRPIVFAPEETVVTLPESRSFRYAMVFGRGVRAEVITPPKRAP